MSKLPLLLDLAMTRFRPRHVPYDLCVSSVTIWNYLALYVVNYVACVVSIVQPIRCLRRKLHWAGKQGTVVYLGQASGSGDTPAATLARARAN